MSDERVSSHDCGSGIEPYEVGRVKDGPFAGVPIIGCPGCGWEWLGGWESVVDLAREDAER